jgi:hypothetical protein
MDNASKFRTHGLCFIQYFEFYVAISYTQFALLQKLHMLPFGLLTGPQSCTHYVVQ